MSAKKLVFWVVIVVAAFLLWQVVNSSPTSHQTAEISYSAFLSRIENGDVTKVVIAGNEVTGTGKDGSSFHVIVPAAQGSILYALQEKNVEVWFKDNPGGVQSMLLNLAPLVLLAALWFFMIRQIKGKKKAEDPANRIGV